MAKKERLSDRVVAKLNPDPALAARGQDTLVWDEALSGFGVKITAKGSKSFFYNYRFDGQQRRLTLGKSSTVSASTARDQAEKALAAVRNGVDPQGVKEEARKALTLRQHAEEWLAQLQAEADRNGKSRRTVSEYGSKLRLHILPAFGAMKPADLTSKDVARWKEQALRARPKGKERVMGAEGVKGCLRVLSAFCGHLVRVGAIATNPAAKQGQFTSARRERYLASEEYVRLAQALDVRRESAPHWVAAIELMLFTGMRKGEVLSLRWDAVRAEERVFLLATHKTSRKTGAKRIPITEQAQSILDAAQSWRRAGNPYVFPSVAERSVDARGQKAIPLDVARGHMSAGGLKRAWGAICKDAGLAGLRIHDLRHNWASVAVGNGVGMPVVGKNLGHASSATTERYAHIQTDAAAQGAAIVAGIVKEQMAKPSEGEKVVRLRR